MSRNTLTLRLPVAPERFAEPMSFVKRYQRDQLVDVRH